MMLDDAAYIPFILECSLLSLYSCCTLVHFVSDTAIFVYLNDFNNHNLFCYIQTVECYFI